MTTIIKRRVYLEPKYLDSNIRQHMLEEIKRITAQECSKEYGYILSVNRIVNMVNDNGTIFTVTFEANTLKPEPGKQMTGIVCMVYNDGIFIDIANKQKMLVPAVTLTGYEFDSELSSYVGDEHTITKGDELDVIVTATKYSNGQFSCFGSLA